MVMCSGLLLNVIYLVFRQTDVNEIDIRLIDQKVKLSLADHYVCFFLVVKHCKMCFTITAIYAENRIH